MGRTNFPASSRIFWGVLIGYNCTLRRLGAPVGYGRRRFGASGRAYSRGLGAPIRVGWASQLREFTASFHHFVNEYASSSQQSPFGPTKTPQIIPEEAFSDSHAFRFHP
jgi:hypothetical protein